MERYSLPCRGARRGAAHAQSLVQVLRHLQSVLESLK